MIPITQYLKMLTTMVDPTGEPGVNGDEFYSYSIKSYYDGPDIIAKPGTVIGTVIGKTTKQLNALWEKYQKDTTLWKH